MCFYDAGGFDPGSEDVLLGGLVVAGADPIQAVQVAGDGNTQGLWGRLWAQLGACWATPFRALSAQSPSKATEGKMARPCPGPGAGEGVAAPPQRASNSDHERPCGCFVISL